MVIYITEFIPTISICIPIAAVIGGGYQRDIEALVNVHLQLFIAAGVIESGVHLL